MWTSEAADKVCIAARVERRCDSEDEVLQAPVVRSADYIVVDASKRCLLVTQTQLQWRETEKTEEETERR